MLSYNLKEVALRLKSLRDLMGVSVQEMAKATDVKESEYEIYEKAKKILLLTFCITVQMF